MSEILLMKRGGLEFYFFSFKRVRKFFLSENALAEEILEKSRLRSFVGI